MATKQLERQVDQFGAARAALVAELLRQIGRFLRTSFAADGWYDDAAVKSMGATLSRLTRAAQRKQVASTAAYLSRVLAEQSGRPYTPRTVSVPLGSLRQGVSDDEVWARVAAQYRYRYFEVTKERPEPLREPEARQQALEAAVERAEQIAETDVGLAERSAVSRLLTTHAETYAITGYRRVIHPELSKSGTCGLCVAASTRIYRTGELMPIHDRCVCTVLPVVERDGVVSDPGNDLNASDLKALYQLVGGTDAAALKNARYSVREHGEVGPVLRSKGQRFRGKAEARRSRRSRRVAA